MCVDAVCAVFSPCFDVHPSFMTIYHKILRPVSNHHFLQTLSSEPFFFAAMNPGKEAVMPDGDVVIIMLGATVQDGRFGLHSLAAICPGRK